MEMSGVSGVWGCESVRPASETRPIALQNSRARTSVTPKPRRSPESGGRKAESSARTENRIEGMRR